VAQLAVTPYTASPPDVDFGFGAEFTGRQLDHSRKHVRFSIRIDTCPRGFAVEVKRGEFRLPLVSEEVIDAVEIKEEHVAALPAKKV
jgi:hypothetical protein